MTEVRCPLSCPDNRDGTCSCPMIVLGPGGSCQRFWDHMRPELDARSRRQLEHFREQGRLST